VSGIPGNGQRPETKRFCIQYFLVQEKRFYNLYVVCTVFTHLKAQVSNPDIRKLSASPVFTDLFLSLNKNVLNTVSHIIGRLINTICMIML
jgi:hypothetical protein